MEGVNKIAFTKLKKFEVFTFYNAIVGTIRKFDTKAMYIGETCDVLIGMQAKAAKLDHVVKNLGPHLLTPEVKKLHQKRLNFAAIITNHMKTVEKAAFKETEHLVELVKPIILQYLNYLRTNDLATVEQLIIQFFDKITETPHVLDAFYELGFKPYLDELQAANNAYIETYSERRGEVSKRPKGSTLTVQRELQNMLDILFKQVDYYQHVYKDVDYSGLITALNYVIAIYTKLIKTRDTQRKNKKLKLKNDEAAALEEKMKMDRIENIQPDTIGNTSVTSTPADETRKEKGKLPVSRKKKEGKDEPINGLLNILKKPDKGKNEDED